MSYRMFAEPSSPPPEEPENPVKEEKDPFEVVVPLDWLQTRVQHYKIPFDESGLFMLSKAVEKFTTDLVAGASKKGTQELNYKTISGYIQKSDHKLLKQFFPAPIRYADLMERLKVKDKETYDRFAAVNPVKERRVHVNEDSDDDGPTGPTPYYASPSALPPTYEEPSPSFNPDYSDNLSPYSMAHLDHSYDDEPKF